MSEWTLVSQRNEWKKCFEEGLSFERPSLLKLYEENRESELWRASKICEYLCEYALYLEREIAKYQVTTPAMPLIEAQL